MLKNMKITAKLLVLVLAITLGTLLIVSVMSYNELLNTTTYLSSENANLGLTASSQSKQALLSQSEEYLVKISSAQTESTNNILRSISTKVTEMSQYITSLYKNRDNFKGRELPLPDQTEMDVLSSKYMLAPGVEMTDALHSEVLLISNAEYAFRPVLANDVLLDNVYLGTVSGISYRFSPYNNYDPTYEPRERIWFKAGEATQDKPVWIDTYLDNYGILCITCAQAFFDARGQFAGVVAIDITLGSVVDEIMNLKIGETGYAFILDSNMSFIAHPVHPAMDESYSLMTTAAEEDAENAEYVRIRNDGLVKIRLDGEDCYLAFSTLEETGWKICICIDVDEIIEPANATKAEIDEATNTAQGKIQKVLSDVIIQYVIIFAAIGIVVIVIAFAISGAISKPILNLVGIAREVGSGNLDAKAPVQGNDEVAELAKSFNSMTENLQQYMTDLTEATVREERIASELSLATKIQADALPCDYPAFPERKEFDLFFTMQPAKEVGGDFYDFFLIDESHLALLIADVSGKGVPAALFMMIGKTLIKNRALFGGSPSEILEFANAQLCENNKAEMFITAWLGILDLKTGILTATNAGHEFPVIRHGNGPFELFKDRHGFVLAGFEASRYRDYSIQLQPGDMLYVYTDGVAEATDAGNELFGTERMLASLNSYAGKDCRETIQTVLGDITEFVGEAPQFDDITMLCFRLDELME